MLALVKTPEGTLDQLRETGRVKPAVLQLLAAQQHGDSPQTAYYLQRVSGVMRFHRGEITEFVNPGGVAEKRIAKLAAQLVADELFAFLRGGGATAGEVQLWAEGR
jgi:hypothetical protein